MSLCCCIVFLMFCVFVGFESRVLLMFNVYDDNLLFRYLMTDKCENFTFFVVVAAAVNAVRCCVSVHFPVHYLFILLLLLLVSAVRFS